MLIYHVTTMKLPMHPQEQRRAIRIMLDEIVGEGTHHFPYSPTVRIYDAETDELLLGLEPRPGDAEA